MAERLDATCRHAPRFRSSMWCSEISHPGVLPRWSNGRWNDRSNGGTARRYLPTCPKIQEQHVMFWHLTSLYTPSLIECLSSGLRHPETKRETELAQRLDAVRCQKGVPKRVQGLRWDSLTAEPLQSPTITVRSRYYPCRGTALERDNPRTYALYPGKLPM